MEEIDIIKWWGATLGTIAFLWNVYNSFSNAPKLKVKIQPHTSYPDAKVISKEVTENGTSTELTDYCHIEITNIGKQPTTVTNIKATHSKNSSFKLSSSSERFLGHQEQKIPFLIKPGEVWSCRLEMEDLYSLENHGKPEIHIQSSYKDKPIVVKPKYTANK